MEPNHMRNNEQFHERTVTSSLMCEPFVHYFVAGDDRCCCGQQVRTLRSPRVVNQADDNQPEGDLRMLLNNGYVTIETATTVVWCACGKGFASKRTHGVHLQECRHPVVSRLMDASGHRRPLTCWHRQGLTACTCSPAFSNCQS